MHEFRAKPGRVVVLGAGALACEIFETLKSIAEAGGDAECISFAVDEGIAAPDRLLGLPVRRDLPTMLLGDSTLRVAVAIGDPRARAAAVDRLHQLCGPRFVSVIHPVVWLGSTVEIGEGTMMFGHVSATARVRIGRHVLINPGCTIAHDVVLEDYVSLGPSVALAGFVHVGARSELGTGAVVIPRRRIAADVFVGAGAAVIHDVAEGLTVVGVPARNHRK